MCFRPGSTVCVMPKRNPDHDPDERISLYGPDPEAVLRALLQVDPDTDPDDDTSDADEQPADR